MNILELKNISKTYGHSFKANDEISLAIKNNEIHAILGENGAGKSTLMKIIYGMEIPDAGGDIFFDGKKENILSPQDAIRLGIGMIHQHFMLIRNLSIYDNILLLSTEAKKDKIKEYMSVFNLKHDLNEKIEKLTVGEQQKVEIIKTLYTNSKIIIFDEPTAVLSTQEIVEFNSLIKKLKAEGKTIIIITHKINEIMELADRVSILAKGKLLGTWGISELSPSKLINLMVGEVIELKLDKEKFVSPTRAMFENFLTLKNINLKNKKLSNINLNLSSKNIIGIAGIDGNGQQEFVKLLWGLLSSDEFTGSIFWNEKEITNLNTYARMHDIGMALIPEDRRQEGLVLDLSIAENIKGPAITLLDLEQVMNDGQIYPANLKLSVGSLSGGNQQKVIIARELARHPKVVIAVVPTRGLDAKASFFVHKKLLELNQAGVMVILISLDLDEILALCDDIYVLNRGKIAGHFEKNTSPQLKEMIGKCMVEV